MKTTLERSSDATEKTEISLEISGLFFRSNLDSALFYSNLARTFSEETGNHTLIAKVRLQKSGILINQREFDDAEKLIREGLEDPQIDSINLARSYQNLGNIFNYKQEYEKAITHYLQGADFFELLKDTISLAKVYTNIGSLNARLGNPQKAIQYLDKALAYARKDNFLSMQILTNLANAQYANNELGQAILTSQKAEKLAVESNAQRYLGHIYSNLCNFYLEEGSYTTSIDYGRKGLAIKETLQQNTDILRNNMGYAHLKQGQHQEALLHFEKIPKKINPDLKILVLNNLRQAHEGLGNIAKALSYANQHSILKDSVNTARQQARVAELTAQHESEKKQQEIDLLQTKDELNTLKLEEQSNFLWVSGLFALLIIILGIIWYQNQKTKQSLQTARIQQRLLQTQLNPHFLFHALNSIQAFIYQNKKEESVGYLGSFSKLMRSILESSDQDFITLQEDIDALTDYMDLQKLGATKPFEHHISIDPEIDTDIVLIPPMFTQPFVENALLHGIKELEDGVIKIDYTYTGDSLSVSIADNGSGFSNNGSNNANQLHRSMSMDILHERVQNLKKTYNYLCSIDLNPKKEGTVVLLTFPVRHKKL
ncbi:tetratricopeptide repeat-containing sensor histidine kinase [Spongiimicrobium salis]|uniref:tetratricopeptide repeat-containing sensor histidine kinase n=1 Tax=Spongiimicrobium salis TaxID=1667022 RepID=UPI00374D9414